jgi:ParB-like chromosome segregation protein Spo0J
VNAVKPTTAPMPPVHPAAELFPMMSEEELRALAEDIRVNGLQQPVVMFGAQLLDGRNRWRACEIAGVEVRVKDWSGKDAVAFVRSLNLHRRHLTPAQRAALAVKAEPIFAEAAERRRREGNVKGGKNRSGESRAETDRDSKRALADSAKTTGASLDSAKQMKQAAQKAPEVVELVQKGVIPSVADAKRVADLDPEQRGEVLELVRTGARPADAIGLVQKVPVRHRALFSSLEKLITLSDRMVLEIGQATDVFGEDPSLNLGDFGAWALIKRLALLEPKLRDFTVLLRSRAGEEE